jgi:uncharacterized membrane protein
MLRHGRLPRGQGQACRTERPGDAAALLLAAILAILPVLYPTLAGFALFVIALAVTLIVEVPIDNQIEAWTVASLPANWQQLRDRWELFHVIRTWVSVIGLALLIVGAPRIGDKLARRSG